MISVGEAQARILGGVSLLGAEHVSLAAACGRVLAADVVARVSQPPADVSAMDGYAVRASDVATLPCTLRLVGSVPAGGAYPGTVAAGEAVRIFTGAPVPAGATTIVIQENVRAAGNDIHVVDGPPPQPGRHIRRAGIDFSAGSVVAARGHRLTPRDIALLAASNNAGVDCARRPRVALLATGDELVEPGTQPGPSQIVSSSALGLGAAITQWGGTVRDLGIARDTVADIAGRALASDGCDVFVTLGGASVGDHDLIQKALVPDLSVAFWKIAMRPGKPLIHGSYRGMPFLGLPGNPVSAQVCALLFLKPLLFRMLGDPSDPWTFAPARLATALPANDQRQDYLRCQLDRTSDGLVATPFPVQDSSMLRVMSRAGGLLVRPPFDPARVAGDSVQILRFEP